MKVMRCFGKEKQAEEYHVMAPPSKSSSHRALICAGLADGTTTLTNISFSQDVLATLRCVEALGASVSIKGDTVTVTGIRSLRKEVVLPCGESGSTLRFMLPIAAALGCRAGFTGEGKLPERPIHELISALSSHGVIFDGRNTLPFSISGKLRGGSIEVAGNVSSQYVTGLLLAAPLLEKDTWVHLTTPLASRSYVEMTVRTMREFGIIIHEMTDGWLIPANQKYCSQNIFRVEGDYSNAAFAMTAGAVGTVPVIVSGLDPASAQGDREILPLLSRFGALVERAADGTVKVSHQPMKGIEVDAQNIPDLVPILCVAASFAEGESRISHVGRLRYKESDRLNAITEGLINLGGKVRVTEDEIYVTGSPLHGGSVSGYNDHRIVMAMAVAALCASEPVDISDYTAVSKSYPNFFEVYRSFGGECHVLELE